MSEENFAGAIHTRGRRPIAQYCRPRASIQHSRNVDSIKLHGLIINRRETEVYTGTESANRGWINVGKGMAGLTSVPNASDVSVCQRPVSARALSLVQRFSGREFRGAS